MSLSSLSSGDEKILNSDGTKIELDNMGTASSFNSHFYPPPNYSASDPYFAWRGMYGNAYSQPTAYASGANNNPTFPNFNYPPPNGYPPYVGVAQPSSLPPVQNNIAPEESTTDPHAATVEYVFLHCIAKDHFYCYICFIGKLWIE